MGREERCLASSAGAALPGTGVILYRNVNTEFILKKNNKNQKTKKTKKKKKPQKTTYMYIGLKVSEVAAFFFFFFPLFFFVFVFVEEI